MALTVQTYRVGVQNRYSAFLEGEEGLALSNSEVKKPSIASINKQRGPVSGSSKPASNKTNGKSSDSSSGSTNKKQDAQVKNSSMTNAQQGHMKSNDVRRQQRDSFKRHQQSNVGSHAQQAGGQYKQRNQNQDGNTSDGMARSLRTHPNSNSAVQQLDVSGQQQQQSKENRATRGPHNPRFNRTPRAAQVDGNQQDVQQQQQQQQTQSQINGHLPSSEGDKARHLQRRMNNLRFKDPEKRERRNQGPGEEAAETQTKSDKQSDGEATLQEQRSPRMRRDFDKNKARPRRVNPNGDATTGGGDPRRDIKRPDRPTRQRNVFGGGSHSEGGRQDKPRQIPNFSDKSDFPSLAS